MKEGDREGDRQADTQTLIHSETQRGRERDNTTRAFKF